MDAAFYNRIANSTAHRPVRDRLSGEVFNNPALLETLLNTALDTADPHHHKACWTLELVLEQHIEWLGPHLDVFCGTLATLSNGSAIRSLSKICLFAVTHSKKNPGFLDANHAEQITEACFDWLIDPKTKVAIKAYAMRALFLLGQDKDWIYPELERILTEDAYKHSAGYQAAAKDILRKIRK